MKVVVVMVIVWVKVVMVREGDTVSEDGDGVSASDMKRERVCESR